MQVEPRDWTVPAPLRTLLWWPPAAFLVVLLDPGAAAGTIAVVGAALAVVGALGTTVGMLVRRSAARRSALTEPVPGPTAMGVPTPAAPVGQRAA